MDVWLPYSDVEIPLSLPDPIDLRIVSRRFTSIERERQMIRRLNDLLSPLGDIRILDSTLLLPSERSLLVDKLRILGLEYEFVERDFNVVVNVVRHDPIYGVTCSYIHRGAIDSLGEVDIDAVCSGSGEPDILYIDLLVDGLGRIQEVFAGDSLDYGLLKDIYLRYWGGYSEPTSLVIAGLGGHPWDKDLYSIVISFAKAADLVSDNIVVLVGDGELSDDDVDILIGVKEIPWFKKYIELARSKLMDVRGRIYYFGSLPPKVCREFGLRYIKDVNRFIKALPVKVKRETTVIEDVLHVYVSASQG